MLILVEGVDGLGKSSLIDSLNSYFEEHNYHSFVLKYPSNKLRKWLDKCLWCKPLSILLLYLDMLIDRCNLSIRASYNNYYSFGIIDRYWISTLCYQFGKDKPNWFIKLFTRFYQHTLYQPDIVIWLDADFEVIVDRLNKRLTYMDKLDKKMETVDNLISVYSNYKFFMPSIRNCYKIDASQTQEAVLKDTLSLLFLIMSNIH